MTLQIPRPELVWQLLGRYGSPLLVGSRSIVRQQLRRLRANLPSIDWFFAVKANDDLELLKTLALEGCGFDIASYQELEKVRICLKNERAAFEARDMARVLHSHPCKSPADIRACYRAGQRRFVIDGEAELQKIAAVASDAKLLIRLNVPHGSGQVAFAQRFGADIDNVASLARKSQLLGLPIEGLAFHVGSQAIDPSDFDAALTVARGAWQLLEAAGAQLSLLDIGGGFPIGYRDQNILPLESYCQAVGEMLDERFHDTKAKIIAEPGRVLCAEAVSLITTVIGKQRRNGKLYYTVDDGRYGTFSGRYFSTNSFDFFPYPAHGTAPLLAPSKFEPPFEPSMIAGPTCDGGDIIACDYLLPNLEIGDAIVATKVGAYSAVSASAFNGIPQAKRVWIE